MLTLHSQPNAAPATTEERPGKTPRLDFHSGGRDVNRLDNLLSSGRRSKGSSRCVRETNRKPAELLFANACLPYPCKLRGKPIPFLELPPAVDRSEPAHRPADRNHWNRGEQNDLRPGLRAVSRKAN